MQAGNLRKRITLQQKSTTQDAFGQFINSWNTLATVWAEVEAVGGDERLHTKQEQSQIRHKVTVRYRTELADPTQVDAWRFIFDGRVLNIEACLFSDMKKRYVLLLCNEGLTADGQ